MQRTSRLVSALVLVGTAFASGSVEPAFSATSLVTLEAESMSATTGKLKTDATASVRSAVRARRLPGHRAAQPARVGAADPDHPLVAERGPDGAWRPPATAQAVAAADGIGQAPAGRGLGPGRPLLVLSGNGVDHLVMTLGAMTAGRPGGAGQRRVLAAVAGPRPDPGDRRADPPGRGVRRGRRAVLGRPGRGRRRPGHRRRRRARPGGRPRWPSCARPRPARP